MQYLPWWMSGLALAGVMLTHWFLTHRMMAVSGRFTALVNRWRFHDEPAAPAGAMTEAELLAAIQAATLEAFGDELNADEANADEANADEANADEPNPNQSRGDQPRPDPARSDLPPGETPPNFLEVDAPLESEVPAEVASASAHAAPPVTTSEHLLFLLALPVGSYLACLLSDSSSPATVLAAPGFSELFGRGTLAVGVLFGGGLLVGFGTRMAGGCTSGHGLCGVSRVQPGSLLATAAFFGAGIATSFLLGAL